MGQFYKIINFGEKLWVLGMILLCLCHIPGKNILRCVAYGSIVFLFTKKNIDYKPPIANSYHDNHHPPTNYLPQREREREGIAQLGSI